MNKGLFGFPASLNVDSFGGFPKKRVSNESFYTIPSLIDNYDFKAIISTAGTSKSFQMTGTGTIIIDWGDGYSESITNPGRSYSHTYQQPGTYFINLSCDTESLTYLGCGNSGFSGIFRDGRKFKNLQIFLASNNAFGGQNFPDISTWTQLVTLRCFTAGFGGELPPVNHCPNLVEYDLSNNSMSGYIVDFSYNVNLEQLKINSNAKLTGLLSNLNNYKLKYLFAFGCSFFGSMPNLLLFPYLIQLDVSAQSGDKLSGIFPSVSNCINLTSLVCGLNKFSGVFPDLTNCTKLENLKINDNSFTNGIIGFESLVNLEIFHCHRNQLSIFPNLSANTKLKHVYCYVNQFVGTVDLTGLDSLLSFIGSSNKFSGTCTLPGNALMSGTFRIDGSYDSDNITALNFNATKINGLSIINHFSLAGNVIDMPLPFGTSIICRNIDCSDIGISAENLNTSINTLFSNRLLFDNSYTKYLAINGARNATASGTYQQPSGFTHDLTEAEITSLSSGWSVKEKVWVLVNCQISSADTTKRYKWTITMN